MMLWGLLCVALVGVAMGTEDCCSAEDRREMQRGWASIWGAEFTGRRLAIGKAVFEHMFEHHPETKAVFKRVNVDDINSAEFKAHIIRVVNGLDTAINLLDDPATLDKQLAHLNSQHLAREGVKHDFFGFISEAFKAVMPKVATCFNPQAWDHCMARITGPISAGLP